LPQPNFCEKTALLSKTGKEDKQLFFAGLLTYALGFPPGPLLPSQFPSDRFSSLKRGHKTHTAAVPCGLFTHFPLSFLGLNAQKEQKSLLSFFNYTSTKVNCPALTYKNILTNFDINHIIIIYNNLGAL